jgi:single-strand DNA-binding protein
MTQVRMCCMSKGTVNKVTLIGNLGEDPSLAQAGQTQVANLSLATTESWKDKNSGENVEKTEWHRVSFWGAQAETVAKYAKKGSKLYIEGRIETRTYEKDGEKKYSTEIRGNNFTFLDRKGSSDAQPERASAPSKPGGDDDLPF